MLRLVLLLLALSFPVVGQAQDTVLWREVGAWKVGVDKTLGNSCFATVSYDAGAVLRLGLNTTDRDNPAYIAIGSGEWKSLKIGNKYELSLQLDRASPWTGTFTAIKLDGVKWLMVKFSETKFLIEVARKNWMKVFYQDDLVVSLSMRRSMAALNEVVKCQEYVDRHYGSGQTVGKDPFAGASDDSGDDDADPFSDPEEESGEDRD